MLITLNGCCKRKEVVFITHLHSGSGVEAKKGMGLKFRAIHLVLDTSVDLERDIDLETLHVLLLKVYTLKMNSLCVLGTK